MHTKLLNLGFIKMPDGSYLKKELNLRVTISIDREHVVVPTEQGDTEATITELEDVIIADGFGTL